MTVKEVPIESPIQEKIAWAEECHRERGADLLGDKQVGFLLKRLKGAIQASHREMAHAGIMEFCRLCEGKDGGSCCGLGLENNYPGTLLLINLLLGHSIPTRRYDPSGCFFLRKEGCGLLARQVICINYLCRKITDHIEPHRLTPLREKEGDELGFLFRLNELIKKKLKDGTSTRLNDDTRKILSAVAKFYDKHKVGDVGALGFRRSTDLSRLVACLDSLIERKILIPGKSLFLDMGCADGRVNVLLSYLVQKSIGIELDEWTLEEYLPLKTSLEADLKKTHIPLPSDNIFLFQGNAMENQLYEFIHQDTGVAFEDVDIFYTYLTMQEEFAGLIRERAKKGALFLVYGLEKIMPRYKGLKLLTPGLPLNRAIALYQKT